MFSITMSGRTSLAEVCVRFGGLTSTSLVWMLTFPAKRNSTEQRNCLYEAEAMLMRTWICDGIGR